MTCECEILYECRICRSIFRSVSNFILHKRNYCQERYNCVIHLKCSNSQEEDFTAVNESISDKKDDAKQNLKNKKSLGSLIESLAQKKQFGFERNDFSISEFYKGYKHGVPVDENCKTKMQLNLDHINGSDAGVFQTLTKSQDYCENKMQELQLEV